MPNPEEFIPFAEQLANAAGEIITQHFRQHVGHEWKGDKTPVTQADREAERAMRAMILQTYAHHGVIGEEFGITNEGSEYTWVLDPIDGTSSFMIGRPIFGTLISLTQKGVPILGLIDQPVLGERWLGVQGFATNFNYEPTRTRTCPKLEDAVLCVTSPDMFDEAGFAAFQKLKAAVRYVVYGGDCYSYGLLANGHVDIILEQDLKPHDFCALGPVLRGAHGSLTDWEGKPLTLESEGKVLACGDKRLISQVADIL